jgi:hypothetical protein
VESNLGPLGTSATYRPVVPAPVDCEDGEFGEKNGRGNLSTRGKPAPAPLFPPQIPLDQKFFDTLVYYVLEISPYLLNTLIIACPYCELILEEGL